MILLAFGSNLPSRYGSPEKTIEASLEALSCEGIEILHRSRIWLTEPVPVSDQPWYRNSVACVQTDLLPEELLAKIKEIETDFGRVSAERNAARVLDIDILAYNSEVISLGGLSIPHPRMHERSFVLYPLAEIAPHWVHPTLKCTLSELLEALPADQKIKLPSDVAA